MALRRSGPRFTANIWPGFVDAMTALLLVLMFVLTIFMIVQFVLRETITGQDEELNNLTLEIASLAQALGLEQQRSAGLEDDIDGLNANLAEARDTATSQSNLIATLTAQSEEQASQIADFESQVASLLAQNSDLTGSLTAAQNQIVVLSEQADALNTQLAETQSTAEGLSADKTQLLADKAALEAANLQIISEKEAVQLALAQARDEIDEQVEQARLAASKREAMEALIANLRNNIAEKTTSLEDALATLMQTQQNLQATQTSLASVENQRELSETERLRLQELLAKSNENLAQTQNDLAQSRSEIATAQARQDLSDAETAQLRALIAQTQQDLRLTQSSLEQTETALNDAQNKLATNQQDLAATQNRLSETTLTAEALEARIKELLQGISDEEKARLAEAAAAEALRARLQDADAELTAMSLALEAKRKEAEDTLTLLAAARAARDDLEGQLDTELSDAQIQAALLAQANAALADEQAVSAESLRKLEVLNQQSAELRKQLNVLQGLLDAAQERDAEAQVQIEALGSNLNVALAQAAAEQRKRAELEEAERKRLEEESKNLEQFKSEFFGQIRGLLEGREGVQMVGDRFVFSSEVLFTAGSAELGAGGQREVAKVASLIREIADKIPDNIDWILRVDGHTDNVPLSGFGAYKNNWELSQARALSVVRYLNEFLGIPANRLAANGFGEHQPIATGNSPEARATNRRIELKFTEK